jgi:hypothetical protein
LLSSAARDYMQCWAQYYGLVMYVRLDLDNVHLCVDLLDLGFTTGLRLGLISLHQFLDVLSPSLVTLFTLYQGYQPLNSFFDLNNQSWYQDKDIGW